MPQPFTAAPHHDILVLLVQLAILLVVARLLGEVAQRFGQPSVVGEILAGVILGPSLISGLFPAISEWLVPHNEVQGFLLENISMLGVMFLLLITGLETDLGLIRHHARTAAGMSLGGLLFMGASGFALGTLLPDDLLVNPEQRVVFALFLAVALAIAAIPVIAKVLMDLNLMRRDAGQTVIAAAMMDDTIGWILLSVVIGLASGVGVTFSDVLRSVGEVLALLIFSLTAGTWLTRRAVQFVQNNIVSREKMLSLVIIWMFLGGAVTQALGLEALLGAFLVGIIFSQVSTFGTDTMHKLESITFGIFSPIFFAVAGLKINITTLFEPRLLLITLLIIVVATVFKVAGVYAGSRVVGRRDHWTALFFGFGLNTRGSMGVIMANIGLELGLLTQELFAILVVNAIVTSLLAPVALRLLVKRMQIGDEERIRLEREALTADNLIAGVKRVLLPVRTRLDDSPIHTTEARILERIAAGSKLGVTLFSVAEKGSETRAGEYLNRVAPLFADHTVTKKVVIGQDPSELILAEAQMSYDLLVLGAPQRTQDPRVLFNPITDYLARFSPCPSLIVHAPYLPDGWQPHRILVPTNGSLAAKRAAEVAFAMAAGDPDAQVSILQVVSGDQSTYALENHQMVERQVGISRQIVGELQTIGESFGVAISSQVEVAPKPAGKILEVARQQTADLIVLGVAVRAGSDRLYLGPMVEYILDNAICPVLVVNVRQ